MSKLSIFQSSCKGQLSLLPSGLHNSSDAKRIFRPKNLVTRQGGNQGWTFAVLRNCSNWLHKLDRKRIQADYDVFWCTFTFRDCPASPKDCAKVKARFFETLNVFCRSHGIGFKNFWLMEFQKRKVPHYHMLLMFDFPDDFSKADRAVFSISLDERWLKAASDYGVKDQSQRVKHLKNDDQFFAVFDYCVQHSRRDLLHEQRMFNSIPDAWNGFTGAVWGKSRDIPEYEYLLDIDVRLSQTLFKNDLIDKLSMAWPKMFINDKNKAKSAEKYCGNLQVRLTDFENNEQFHKPHGFNFVKSEAVLIRFIIDEMALHPEYSPVRKYVSFESTGDIVNLNEHLARIEGVPF